MQDLLDVEPQQPDPDSDGRIPYFEPPTGEELPTESGNNDNG